jgi:hypothetical protein
MVGKFLKQQKNGVKSSVKFVFQQKKYIKTQLTET